MRKATERMHREPARKEGVWKQMRETIEAGHARKVENLELPEGVPTYYLPLHIVPKKGRYDRSRFASELSGYSADVISVAAPRRLFYPRRLG